MHRILLVRHAEPHIEPEVSAARWGLTARGVASTQRLVTALAELGPTVIVASSERKAMETARILADALGLPVERDERFSEQGAEEGEFLADYVVFRALVERHFAHPEEAVLRQESSYAAGARFADCLQARFGDGPGDIIPVIVSHGRIMASWLGELTHSSAWDIWTDLRMPDLVDVDLERRTFQMIRVPLA